MLRLRGMGSLGLESGDDSDGDVILVGLEAAGSGSMAVGEGLAALVVGTLEVIV